MSEKNARIRLNAETSERLESYCATTGASVNDVAAVAIAQFLFACTGEAWPKLAQTVAQNGPAPVTKSEPDAKYVPDEPVRVVPSAERPPDYGRQLGDSPESLAILAELNALPLVAEAANDDLAELYAVRRFDVQRRLSESRQKQKQAAVAALSAPVSRTF